VRRVLGSPTITPIRDPNLIGQVDLNDKTAQDAPGTIFLRGVATWVSPVLNNVHPQKALRLRLCRTRLRRTEDAVDAAIPVDAKNAPTRDLETTEQFPQRQQRSFFLEGQEEPTKNLSTPILEQIGYVFQFRRAAGSNLFEAVGSHPEVRQHVGGKDLSGGPSQPINCRFDILKLHSVAYSTFN